MADVHVLWLTHKGDGYVGAPQTQYGFEQEVAQLCDCKFAGEGWPLYRAGESLDETVQRVMPDADWVIDKDNALFEEKPHDKGYMVGHFISDLHGKHHYKIKSPVKYADALNQTGYDAVFMRYPLIQGTGLRPDVVYDRLKCEKRWVPWSVEAERYHPRREKKYDVSFIGTVGAAYPLRKEIWDNIYYVARGHRILRQEAPRGKTYDRSVETLQDSHLVGEDYRRVLGETRILLFGCSRYRYALQKFFEAPASGCLVVSNAPSMAKRLGFVGDDTFVEVDAGEWEDTLIYLLENPGVVKRIAQNGTRNVLKNHTHKVRARQFLEMIT